MTNRHMLILPLIAIGALAACGKAGNLERPDNMGPQPVAYGANKPESAGQLIKPSPQADPGRSSTLLNSSSVRRDSVFDVPPGAANVPFPGDPLTADFQGEDAENGGDDDDDGA